MLAIEEPGRQRDARADGLAGEAICFLPLGLQREGVGLDHRGRLARDLVGGAALGDGVDDGEHAGRPLPGDGALGVRGVSGVAVGLGQPAAAAGLDVKRLGGLEEVGGRLSEAGHRCRVEGLIAGHAADQVQTRVHGAVRELARRRIGEGADARGHPAGRALGTAAVNDLGEGADEQRAGRVLKGTQPRGD